MKVALVGANGFIGTRIVEQFHLGQLHTIVPIVRKPSSLALPARFDVDWRIGDALDIDSLAKALTGCDAIVHSALGDTRQIESMPAVLGAAAAKAGIKRVVYLSSASVHGQNPAAGTDESTPLRTDQAMDYNNAKVRAESAFFKSCQQHGLEGFALRPGVVFGPRSRWIADLAADLRKGSAWLFKGGSGLCNSIYVDNVVFAVARALTAPAGAAGAYLIGDAETVTWREFYHPVATRLGIDPATIHALDQLPVFSKTRAERIEKMVAGPAVQALLPAVPYKLKRIAKNLLAASRSPAAADAWSLPPAPAPRITEELALLQQCGWKFPHTKAATHLGYTPPVAFATGLARSLDWLAFATDPHRR